MNGLAKKNILGIFVTDAKKEDILQYILISLEKSSKQYYVVTPNPEIIMHARKQSSFASVLNNAEIALTDGIGVIMAGKVLGNQLQERFTGIDCMLELCSRVAEKPITVGFLGGRSGVAEKTAECLIKKYPGLKVTFVAEEWGEEGFAYGKIRNSKFEIRNSIDILFVAFGFPKQEEFMAKHVGKIPVRVMMGVGGAFDYISGFVPRAPRFIQYIGLEWLYRLLVQPWRIKRQLILPVFALIVVQNFLLEKQKK